MILYQIQKPYAKLSFRSIYMNSMAEESAADLTMRHNRGLYVKAESNVQIQPVQCPHGTINTMAGIVPEKKATYFKLIYQ